METIRVVLDSKLLRAAEAAARRAQLSRSALIREALRAHLKSCLLYTSAGWSAPIGCATRNQRRQHRHALYLQA